MTQSAVNVADWTVPFTVVVIAGAGPTGLMLAAELKLAGVDPVVLERRESQELVGSRGGGFHSRTIELLEIGRAHV